MTRAACVLSGGGLLAVGWELGVLEGLRQHGVDIDRFERVIGTSAGAIAGGIVTSGGSFEALAPSTDRDLQLAALVREANLEAAGAAFGMLAAGGDADPERRAVIGAIALGASLPEERFVDIVAQLVPDGPWPARLIVTAVNVDDGSFVAWGSGDGVPIVRAVAASASLPGISAPVTVAGRRWIDGGFRSPTSADLAADSDLVVIVAPPPRSQRWDGQVAAETTDIRAAGGEIIEIHPDDEARAAFGPDMMDGRRQPQVVEAGIRQGREIASEVIARLA